ncbi:MAG: hypothetical protein KDB27_07490 [Planctomycetales bacterium]|nr:hypothetical protein [Planctomycetales bacterium]
MLVTAIDDAHPMDMNTSVKRGCCPKNHNLLLIGSPVWPGNPNLSVNLSTCSAITGRLRGDSMGEFIHRGLDRIGLVCHSAGAWNRSIDDRKFKCASGALVVN